jgi:hypothetical protein
MKSSQVENLAGLTGKVKGFAKRKEATLVGVTTIKNSQKRRKAIACALARAIIGWLYLF